MSFAGAISGPSTIYSQASQANALRSQAKATRASGQAQADAAEFDAEVQENNAAFARNAAIIREDTIRRAGERLQAKATAMAGAEGIDVGSGDVVLAKMDAAANIETDAQRAHYVGEHTAVGFEARATSLRYQGSVAQIFANYNANVLTSAADVLQTQEFFTFLTAGLGGAQAAYNASQTPAPNLTPYSSPVTGPMDTSGQIAGPAGADFGGVGAVGGGLDMSGAEMIFGF